MVDSGVKMHGGMDKELKNENVEAVKNGLSNLKTAHYKYADVWGACYSCSNHTSTVKKNCRQ